MAYLSSSKKVRMMEGETGIAEIGENRFEPKSATTPLFGPPSFPSLNIAAYPHILQLIIDLSSPSSLAILMQCSKHIFHAAAPVLYRELRITHHQLKHLLEVGYEPSKRGLAAGLLGAPFSPSLLECLHHLRVFHLLDYDQDLAIPTIPLIDRKETSLTLIIYADHLPQGPSVGGVEFPTLDTANFNALCPTRVVMRLSATVITPLYTIRELPLSTKEFAFIVPLCLYSENFSTCHFEVEDFVRGTPMITVLLPTEATSGSQQQPSGVSRSLLDLYAALSPSTLVGGEYLASSRGSSSSDPGIFRAVNKTNIRSKTFAKWLEEESGGIFTQKEKDELREADRVLVEQIAMEG